VLADYIRYAYLGTENLNFSGMAFHFKIQLKEVAKPPVWRKIVVPDTISMLKFHMVIQAAFGWTNSHLFEFVPIGRDAHTIGIPDEAVPEVRNASRILLKSVFQEKGQKCTYVYDFGDYWVHSVILELITEEKIKQADCLAGKGACPPEDCGGVAGYENLKKILTDPKNPEHQEMKEWLGLHMNDTWDANEFDLEETSETIRSVL